MDAKTLAIKAYRQLIEEAFELQQRIILNKALQDEFGSDALPAWDFKRRSLHHMDLLRQNPEQLQNEEIKYRDLLTEKLSDIHSLEDLFATQKQKDDKQFAKDMAEFFRSRSRG